MPTESVDTLCTHASNVMSVAAANEVFAFLLEGKLGRCWDRLAGGCEYRAEAAIRLLARHAGVAFKAWAMPHIDQDGIERWPLTPRRQSPGPGTGTFQTWGFHVAPAALVQTGASQVQLKIFDPALLDGPCAVERWMWSLSASKGRFLLTSSEVFMIDTKSLAFSSPPSDDVIEANLAEQSRSPDAVMPQLPAEMTHGR